MIRITHLNRFSQKAKGLPKICSKQFTKRSNSSSAKNATANKSKIEKSPNNSEPENVPVKSFAIGIIAGITGSLVGLGGGFLMSKILRYIYIILIHFRIEQEILMTRHLPPLSQF